MHWCKCFLQVIKSSHGTSTPCKWVVLPSKACERHIIFEYFLMNLRWEKSHQCYHNIPYRILQSKFLSNLSLVTSWVKKLFLTTSRFTSIKWSSWSRIWTRRSSPIDMCRSSKSKKKIFNERRNKDGNCGCHEKIYVAKTTAHVVVANADADIKTARLGFVI